MQRVPSEFNAFAYIVSGAGEFGPERERGVRGQMVMFAQDADVVEIVNSDTTEPLNVLLIGGVPLNEPVVRYGPFVMNTREEIYQAVEDYRNGRMARSTSNGG